MRNTSGFTSLGLWLMLAAMALLPACGQIPLEERAPEQFDLTGYWVQADQPSGRAPQPAQPRPDVRLHGSGLSAAGRS